MAFVTADTLREHYDAIVVGSGAAGGQTAYTLAMDGATVLMLEAGRNYDPLTETPMFQENFRGPLRATGTPDKPFGFHDATVGGGWTVPGEPYTNASTDPARQFTWWRSRMLGGRTNHWARNAFRNGPYDFKPKTRDGLGFDWPIAYEDLAPYYDKVEMLIGVFGTNEGLENSPHSSPGVLMPPPKARVGEQLVKHRVAPLGLKVVPIHRAILSQRMDHEGLPKKLHPNNPKAQAILAQDMLGRAACFWATPCGRGCSIRANYQSTTVHLPPALATGNLDILADAMVREVTLGKDGKASGVSYIERATGKERQVRGRIVVLAASAGESVRILLNSKSALFPNGLANSSGKVGRYIMDTVGASVRGQVPLLENLPPHNEDGAGGDHVYIPWWLYREQKEGKLNFPRPYHIEFGTGKMMPSLRSLAGLETVTHGSYGKRFKEDARRYYGSFVHFSGRGEMIPNEHSFCDLDPDAKDRWGVPVLRFHWQWSDHEKRQAGHMHRTFASIIESMGGKVLSPVQEDGSGISNGGLIIHEVGGARMGSDASDSVTNAWGQCWDVKNLFITDGAVFASKSHKNPTLTIMALAWRSSDYMLQEMQRGNL